MGCEVGLQGIFHDMDPYRARIVQLFAVIKAKAYQPRLFLPRHAQGQDCRVQDCALAAM